MTQSAFPPPALRHIAEQVSELLKERNETVSVAETAAGGLISASLLAMPGASKYYKGGLTLYTLPSRIAFASWTQEHISSYTGPTPSICTGLAQSTIKQLDSTYCVAESGTAGPTGGNTRERTPGYVALSVVTSSGAVHEREVETGLGGDREGNMVTFAAAALSLLKDVVEQKTSGKSEL